MKKILIVDDELYIRQIYFRLLLESGYSVCWAKDATQATNIIIRESIDLILLDIKMPGIDGRVMFDIIRQYNPSLKVIVSSVYPIEKQKKMIPSGVDYYFDKSEGPFCLLEKVKACLSTMDHCEVYS